MTARVLVVDDILANVKLLEARLNAEYFEVLTANSGIEALDICDNERVDVVLLDVMMPGMDGFEVCRRIKGNPLTHHVPVVMVTALDQPSDKIQGLEAGADDFLTKPVDDIALITRVKNLARLKMLSDEMAMRASTTQKFVKSEISIEDAERAGANGHILLVDDHARSAKRMVDTLAKSHRVSVESDVNAALEKLGKEEFDTMIVSLSLSQSDGLRLCSQVRAREDTRHLPIMILVEPGDDARLLRGLDMGVNDYLMRPVDHTEMAVRVKTQIKRKRHSDMLHNRLEESVEQAIMDPLTDLHNKRYMDGHLKAQVAEALESGRPLSVMIADIDFFKLVNATYGQDAGDRVLREFAARFRHKTRGIDLPCRLGGEEFIVIMPDTAIERAYQVAERLRACIAAEPFQVNAETYIRVTASAGISTLENAGDTPQSLLKRAESALYAAKNYGRNRVVADAA